MKEVYYMVYSFRNGLRMDAEGVRIETYVELINYLKEKKEVFRDEYGFSYEVEKFTTEYFDNNKLNDMISQY